MAATHSLDLESSSSQYASIADASCPNLEITGSQTYEGWIKTESTGTNKVIVAKGKASTAVYHQMAVNSATEQLDLYIVGLTTNDFLRSNTVILTGVWYHVAGVYDSSAGKLRVYINGELDKEVTAGGTASDTNSNFAIGCNFSGGSDAAASFFDGLLRNVRVWNVARTQAQIRADMNVDTPSVTTGLQGNWILNNAYTDSSGNGYTLTASGSPVFSTTYPDAINLTENGAFTKKHKIIVQASQVPGSTDLTDVPIVLTESNFLSTVFDNTQGQEINTNALKSDSSLKAYYRFESGALTTDSSGNSNTLSAVSDPAETTGKFGGGVDLDSNDYYTITDHSSLKPTGSFSVGGWIKHAASAGQHAIFSSYSENTNVAGFNIGMNANLGGANKASFIIGRNTGTTANTDYKTLVGSITIGDGAWHHIVATWDTATMRIYVDGNLDASVAWANAPAYAATNYPRVGVTTISGILTTNFWTGDLDDIFLFNGKALSQVEVEQIYKGGADLRFSTDVSGKTRLAHEVVSWDTAGKTGEVWVKANTLGATTNTPIYVHYKNPTASALDENEAFGKHQVYPSKYKAYWHMGTTTDSTQYSNDMTLANSPVYTAAKLGTGLDLELSSSQYATVTDSTSNSITGSITIGGWVKFESLPVAQQDILTRWNTATNKRAIRFNKGASGTLELLFSSDGTSGSVQTQFITDASHLTSTDTWYHVTVTLVPSSDTCIFYVNGSAVASTRTINGSATTIYDSNEVYTIGGIASSATFDGVIDELFMANEILSADYIATLYNNQNSPGTFATASAVGNTSAFFMFL